ncbi:MAG: LamG domain-containing protein [Kiritimatiellaceae bacterium]|nr:LamG domain-containing protein [Kiritimatiellaceae bacterium]
MERAKRSSPVIRTILLMQLFGGALTNAYPALFVLLSTGVLTNAYPAIREVGPTFTYTTITSAVAAANANDVILIHEGVYPETVTVTGKTNLFIKAAPGEHVLITGCNTFTNWLVDTANSNIYTSRLNSIDVNLDHPDVFINGKLMAPAAWPNLNPEDFHYNWWGTNSYAFNGNNGTATVGIVTGSAGNYWAGGTYLGLNGMAWVSIEGKIVASTISGLTCSNLTTTYWKDPANTKMVGLGQGMILFHTNALDSAGEWYWDAGSKKLSLYGGNPGTNVQVRVRALGMKLDKCKNVTVQGLNFRAASVKLVGTTNCSLLDCSVLYGTSFYDRTNQTENAGEYSISTDNACISNKVTGCYVAHGWGGGILVAGGGMLVEDCVIEDFDWNGGWQAGIFFNSGSTNCTVKRNTISKTGRSAISGVPSDSLIRYNRLSDTMILSRDGGAMYLKESTGGYGRFPADVAYNWIEHCYDFINRRHGVVSYNVATGLYSDNGSDAFRFHHNVIWRTDEGLRLNGQPGLDSVTNARVYNNTIWDISGFPMDGLSTDCTLSIKTYNNLAMTNHWVGDDIRNNMTNTAANLFVDSTPDELIDFRLKAGSVAINFGTVANGIPATDEYQGTNPEAGAYEYSSGNLMDKWEAGANSRYVAIDEFETGGISGGGGWVSSWTLTGQAFITNIAGRTGNYGLMLRGSAGSDSAARTLSLKNLMVPSLTFWWKATGFDGAGEKVTVKIIDGTVTNTVKTITGKMADGYWHFATIDLTPFHFTGASQSLIFDAAGLSGTSDTLRMDELTINEYGACPTAWWRMTGTENTAISSVGNYGNNKSIGSAFAGTGTPRYGYDVPDNRNINEPLSGVNYTNISCFGNAVSNSLVVSNCTVFLSREFTIECFVKLTTNAAFGWGGNAIVSKTNTSSTASWALLVYGGAGINNGCLYSQLNDGVNNYCSVISTNPITDDQWHHIAMTVKGNDSSPTVNTYLDGECFSSKSIPASSVAGIVETSGNLVIGNMTAAGLVSAEIDEVRYTARALDVTGFLLNY